MRKRLRLQSAMEYLMTYGWAILIIAIVLGALFALGLFNLGGPRAQAGSCEVYRPYGPGTGAGAALSGQCNGEIPQYAPIFYGNNRGDVATDLLFPASDTINFTLVLWFSPSATSCAYCGIVDADNGDNGWGLMWWSGSPTGYVDFWIDGQGYTQDMNFGGLYPNTWTFVAITYTDTGTGWYANGYINGALLDPNVQRGPIVEPIPFDLAFGMARGSNNYFGQISNVQLYNTTLSSTEIKALYLEGIGGAPLRPQNLVGWWPLNGNANDYSGNNNNGQLSGVTFTSSWTSGYTAP